MRFKISERTHFEDICKKGWIFKEKNVLHTMRTMLKAYEKKTMSYSLMYNVQCTYSVHCTSGLIRDVLICNCTVFRVETIIQNDLRQYSLSGENRRS